MAEGLERLICNPALTASLSTFFPGAPIKIDKQAISYWQIFVSKQKLLLIIFGRLSAFFTACTIVYVTRLSSDHEQISGYLSAVTLLHNILWYSMYRGHVLISLLLACF